MTYTRDSAIVLTWRIDMTKEDLIELLKQKEVLVTFTKKDNSSRKMRCTLQADAIPAVYGSTPSPHNYLITVFDLDNQGWRNINLSKGFTVEGS